MSKRVDVPPKFKRELQIIRSWRELFLLLKRPRVCNQVNSITKLGCLRRKTQNKYRQTMIVREAITRNIPNSQKNTSKKVTTKILRGQNMANNIINRGKLRKISRQKNSKMNNKRVTTRSVILAKTRSSSNRLLIKMVTRLIFLSFIREYLENFRQYTLGYITYFPRSFFFI